MDIQAVSTAIAKALSTLTVNGAQIGAYDYGPDIPNSPCAYIYPTTDVYGADFGGIDNPKFVIRFLISSTQTEGGQAALNALISTGTSTTTSAVDAIRKDNKLGGVINSCRVETLRNYGVLTLGDVRYYSAELVLDVLG